MRRIALAALVALVLAVPSAAARRAGSHPRVLTTLVGLGTVYFRHACPRGAGAQTSSLGVRLFAQTPTTGLTWSAGARTIHRTVADPAVARTMWFPSRTDRIQRLRLESGSEAGNHIGNVTVDFGVAGCFAYQTPSVTMRTYVQHH